MKRAMTALLAVLAPAGLWGCGGAVPAPEPPRYTYIAAGKLAEEIGFGGGDALTSIITGLGDYRTRCRPYADKEVLTQIGVIAALETATWMKGAYFTPGLAKPAAAPRLQTQPPGTAKPFGRTVWVDVSNSPRLLDDMIERCNAGNICNYTVTGKIRFDEAKLGAITDKASSPVEGCMLVVDGFKYEGQNGFYTAIVTSAAAQAVEDHMGDVVAGLSPGQ